MVGWLLRIGFLLTSPLLGMIADAAGLRLAFLIPAGTGLVVLAAAVGLGALRPEGPRARA